MPGLMDNLQTINSLIRTVLALTVAGSLGTAGYYGLSHVYQRRT